MIKHNFDIDSKDMKLIEAMVRESNSLVGSPSNISNLYDAQRYRNEHFLYDIKLKAVLDNNIFTQILPLVDGRKIKGEPLNKEVKLICAIMCFLKYSGIETIPTLALHERPERLDLTTRNQEDYFFRIAERLHPQIFSNLALGIICDISQEVIDKSKKIIDSNQELLDEISQPFCEMEKSEEFLFTYYGILKAFLLYKKEKNEILRLELFLNWYYSFSLFDPILFFFIVIILSNSRVPKMIKNINSIDFHKIKKSIYNATWDLKYLSLFQDVHQQSPENEIWFFCTRDKVLLELSSFVFAFPAVEDIHQFVGEKYSKNKDMAIDLVNIYMKNIEKRRNSLSIDEHKKKVKNELNSNIYGLEEELKECLKTY